MRMHLNSDVFVRKKTLLNINSMIVQKLKILSSKIKIYFFYKIQKQRAAVASRVLEFVGKCSLNMKNPL